MKTCFNAAGREIVLFPARSEGAPLVILNGEAGEAEAVRDAVLARTDAPFSLAGISGIDWNRELSPWPAPPAFRRGEGFGGGADTYLNELTRVLLPRVREALPAKPGACVLAGYSLAGLFALYALYRSTEFDGAVSASGSLWYPGFLDFATENRPASALRAVYLSVGDLEAHTRNPVMRPVEDNTACLAGHYRQMGITTRYELNPGNHFLEPEKRLAKGIAWMIGRAI